ncbi:UNVERIFIED_CONTAM: hypothetical protein GTU68_026690 [Idotea baltica]|nr:hypothetical protein [Idotea baltica]
MFQKQGKLYLAVSQVQKRSISVSWLPRLSARVFCLCFPIRIRISNSTMQREA